MAGLLDRMLGRSSPAATPRGAGGSTGAFGLAGVGGTPIYGGVVGGEERNPKLLGRNRWKTAEEQLKELSIVAAGVRYFLNLLARPTWRVVPAEGDGANFKAMAEEAAAFMDSVLHGTDASWSRIVRRDGMFKFHGFGLDEWQAKRRDDGRIGIATIRKRPAQTISRWDLDGQSEVLGAWQTPASGGSEIYLPRQKLIYFVDDTFTDSPEGMGWSRHLVEPLERMRAYLNLEKLGFQRDLSGIPIGRAPINAINEAVKAGKIKREDGDAMIDEMRKFVQLKAKEPDTGLVLDSQPFTQKGTDGQMQATTIMQWGIELLTGEPGSIEELGAAISRTTWDCALIIGIERLLIGREGAGSLALSGDTSQNLFLAVNSTLGDMAEGYDRDLVGPVWALNGIDPALRPTLLTEDASFKDVGEIAKVLAEMATAGAILAPDDPAINDVRDLLGISHQPEMTPERAGMLGGTPDPNADPDSDPTDPAKPEE